ncbi:MAG: hypothetical protein ACRCT1_19105, partial [Microcoleaceae cyanobacterium]
YACRSRSFRPRGSIKTRKRDEGRRKKDEGRRKREERRRKREERRRKKEEGRRLVKGASPKRKLAVGASRSRLDS